MHQHHISKKQISNVIMPEVGTVLSEKYKVTYVNKGQFKLTAEGPDIAPLGSVLEWDGRKFKVCWINSPKNRFSAEFIGYDENVVTPEAPVDVEESECLLDDEDIKEG